MRDAEQYLSQAQWSVMQAASSAPPSLHSQLQRRLGMLAIARGELQAARQHFAEDVSHWLSMSEPSCSLSICILPSAQALPRRHCPYLFLM